MNALKLGHVTHATTTWSAVENTQLSCDVIGAKKQFVSSLPHKIS